MAYCPYPFVLPRTPTYPPIPPVPPRTPPYPPYPRRTPPYPPVPPRTPTYPNVLPRTPPYPPVPPRTPPYPPVPQHTPMYFPIPPHTPRTPTYPPVPPVPRRTPPYPPVPQRTPPYPPYPPYPPVPHVPPRTPRTPTYPPVPPRTPRTPPYPTYPHVPPRTPPYPPYPPVPHVPPRTPRTPTYPTYPPVPHVPPRTPPYPPVPPRTPRTPTYPHVPPRTLEVPSTNLQADEKEDFKEFEPFDGESDMMPRGIPPDAEPLNVVGINMRKEFNEPSHYTADYMTNLLVVRRGQQFTIDVTFNREVTPQDDFQVEFLIGADPSPHKRSLVVVTFGNRPGGLWVGQIAGQQGTVVSLGITPDSKAIIGLYRIYVAILMPDGMQRTDKDSSTNLYLLCNPWCPDDDVFYPDEAGRLEYVLNPTGIIHQGSVGAVSERNWVFGQCEKGILDACIYIMDCCQMPIHNRGDIVSISRKASAMINSQNDDGVLVGNWSDDFSMGTSPTSWTGSAAILLKYHNTGVPVMYGQCWVYAGVLCTFLRCLGIPCRVITNFNSAHDNTGNLKTELIFKKDGTPDRRNTRDSIWNYHCWCEAFMKRPDIPPKYSGWQVVDATPQETSDGYFRCGPAPVIAIKDGELCHPFDCGFVFAEVNSDVVYLKSDQYGTLTPFKVDTTYVGALICTKSVGSWGLEEVTLNYKYPEGSAENSRTMATAEEYGCERDHSEVPETKLSVEIITQPCALGDVVKVVLKFNNQDQVAKTVTAHFEVSVVFYTGVVSDEFKAENFTLHLPPFQSSTAMFEISPQEYMPSLGSQLCLHFDVNGTTGDEKVSDVKVLWLEPPGLTITLSGIPRVNHQMYASVHFKNPFNMTLIKARLVMEGAGLLENNVFYYK
ncbi:coagulation factor XIII A chain-like [Xenentodon cancila]